jgi:hypothetical protein
MKRDSRSRTPEERLQGICDALNATRHSAESGELIGLLRDWMEASSLAAMLRKNAGLDNDLRNGIEIYFEAQQDSRRGEFRVMPKPPKGTPQSFAIWMFAHLVTNPLCEKLAGPCARCGRFYIKKRASQKVYCSRQCGNAATALARTRERIESERNDKLDRAKVAINQWKREKPNQDWRPWVSQRTGIDLRFLTRHQTEITKPTKGR